MYRLISNSIIAYQKILHQFFSTLYKTKFINKKSSKLKIQINICTTFINLVIFYLQFCVRTLYMYSVNIKIHIIVVSSNEGRELQDQACYWRGCSKIRSPKIIFELHVTVTLSIIILLHNKSVPSVSTAKLLKIQIPVTNGLHTTCLSYQ